MTHRLHRWGSLAALALSLLGCINGLDEATLVKTPRILAMVSDHPEAAPGQDVTVRVLAFDPMHRELHYAFRSCFSVTEFLGLGTSNGSGGMAATTGACSPWTDPGPSNEGTLPGAITQQLVTMIDTLPPSPNFDPQSLRNLLSTAGGPVHMEVRVSVTADDGTETILVSGLKQIGITTRATLTTNPPYVYFHITTRPPRQHPDADPVITTYLGGFDAAHPFDCIPWLTEPATAIASTEHALSDASNPAERPNELVLSPADDPTTWEESFPASDYSGGMRTGYEGAYYSWYSTASLVDRHGVVHSSLHGQTTQAPAHGAPPSAIDDTIRDNTLDVPREPGTYDLWVVLRDGHLGESACHLTFEVTAPP